MMKIFPVLVTAMLAGGASHAATFNAANPASNGYSLVYSDNFSSLNPGVWETDWWYASQDACQVAYRKSATMPGTLGLNMHIQSLETVPACAGARETYSDAHLDAFGSKLLPARTTGYWEASIRIAGSGDGMLTAWWLLPQSGAWPPEIDITEIRGLVPQIDYMTNHWGTSDNPQDQQKSYQAPANLDGAFHTYGVLVDGTHVTWLFDGVQKAQMAEQADQKTAWFPVLSLYTGDCNDGWAGCPRLKTGWSADAYVAWVHVWAAPAVSAGK